MVQAAVREDRQDGAKYPHRADLSHPVPPSLLYKMCLSRFLDYSERGTVMGLFCMMPVARRSLVVFFFFSCVSVAWMEQPVMAQTVRPAFLDRTADLKLQPGGSAACWADLNRDGWIDLIAGGVWQNDEGRSFHKVTDGVGSVVAADYDNDGFVDLFSWSGMRLFRNEGGKSLVPVELPELPACVSRGACWTDLNNDRFVDLYIGGYEDWNKGITYPDLILFNEGGKRFRLAWSETRYRARGVTACDYDTDGDQDIYVSNYRLQPNILWINDGTGKLRDETVARNAAATSKGFAGGHAIGSAWGDFDNDGWMDLFAGNFAHVDNRGDQPKSRFLRNMGPDHAFTFKDKGTCGIHYQESYASPSAADYDNDGDLDLYFTTVYATASFGRHNYPALFRNDGKFLFVDVTEASGLQKLPATYQAAWADYDRDGDLDLATAGRVFENQCRANHWLEIVVKGDGQQTDRYAIGTQVRLHVGPSTLTRQVEAGTGEGNQNSPVLHFGLGEHSQPLAISIAWPGGQRQHVDSVKPDQRITVSPDRASMLKK